MLNSLRPTFLVLVASLTANLTVEAAEWVAEPSVSLREEYNDNYRLTNAEHDSVWGTILDPRLKLQRRSELWDMDASGRLRAARYAGQDGLDTVDNFFDVAAKRRMERGAFKAKASLINDTTLQDEQLDFDTGVTTRQIDRMRQNLNLGGEYMFTETNWLEASLDYGSISYDDGKRYGLYDYDTLTPELRLVHQYNEQMQVFGTLSHSDTKYDDFTDDESKTDSLQLGAAYDITETWNVSASVGSQRTNMSSVVPTRVPRPGLEFLFPLIYDIAFVNQDIETTGLVYDASTTHKFETGSLSLSVSKASEPSSNGTSEERTRFNLNGDLQLSAKLSGRLAVSYNQSSTESGSVIRRNNQNEDRYRIAPSLTWQLYEELALNTGYIYTRVKHDRTIDETVDSNAVFVSLGYSWPRMSMSR